MRQFLNSVLPATANAFEFIPVSAPSCFIISFVYLVIASDKLGHHAQCPFLCEGFRTVDKHIIQLCLFRCLFLGLCKLGRDRKMIDRYTIFLTSLFVKLIMLPIVLV